MQYVTLSPTSTAQTIAIPAPSQVNEGKGISIAFLQYPTETVNRTPQRMMHVIALALDMNPECYRWRTRVRHIVEMRFIASMMLRQYFPALTLQQIGAHFGGQDHTSVINGISRAHELIYVKDASFLKKYSAASKAVTAWLGQDMKERA
ncbi:hypothetical protein GCM10023093_16780 [Nemorincola caseinilytica]|uniref:Chromosomal replication initiator DnaA C-terminal domain-containing protein n=1 Tax=Nemorincola caseinilytica TaxID=2054315 RepID=A0ABP8NCQ3_9BACT